MQLQDNITSLYGGAKSRSPSKQNVAAFRMKYLGPEAYNMEQRPTHNSPCMSLDWIHQPIRQGKTRQEHDHEEKPEDEEKQDDEEEN